MRLRNDSQLSGFSKATHLPYFLREILGIDYVHLPELAPTKEILDAYKKHKRPWNEYVPAFKALMRMREIEKSVDPEIIKGGCLLCSEDEHHCCHRHLVAEYLQEHWGDLDHPLTLPTRARILFHGPETGSPTPRITAFDTPPTPWNAQCCVPAGPFTSTNTRRAALRPGTLEDTGEEP